MNTPRSLAYPLLRYIALVLLAVAGVTAARAQIPTTGLVANYEFTGNAADSGPHALHGTVQGATLTNDRFGAANRAYAFNGTSAYIEIADHNAFSVPTTGALSISVWLRPDVLIFPVDESSGYVHWLGKGVSGQHEWVFRMYSADNTENRENRTSFYMFNLAGGLGAGSYVQEPVTTGAWIHYVAVVNMSADTITWYKNGVQKDQDPFQNSQYNIVPQNGTAPVRIGTRNFTSYFQGAIDDIRFYNRVLTLSEIQQLYNEGNTGGSLPPAPTGLTATPGNAQVSLAWSPSAGATSYNVKRSPVSGGPYTTLASGITSLAHTDTTVTNGTTYYYVVSAVNAAGESANSSQASATPAAATTLHVANILVDRVAAGGGASRSQAVVTIVDSSGSPVANATVTVQFSQSISETKSGVTNASGNVTLLTTGTAANPAKTTGCVTNVSHATLTYNAAANVKTCDNSY